MNKTDQDLIFEAYLQSIQESHESFQDSINLKQMLSPIDLNSVRHASRNIPELEPYIRLCNTSSCYINKNDINKILRILEISLNNMYSKENRGIIDQELADHIDGAFLAIKELSNPSLFR